jgi:hypothetical protein
MNAKIPQCAPPPSTFTEATRPKEVKALLKFGRDSDWPLKVRVPSALYGENSISGAYPIEWEGCVSKVEWFLGKSTGAALRGGLRPLPVETREGVGSLSVLQKDDNTFRVILCDKGADEVVVPTPEDPGIPPLILYGPHSEIKLRCSGLEVAEAYLRALCGGRMSVTGFPSKEWAIIVTSTPCWLTKEWVMIGLMGDGVSSGTIPERHRAVLDESLAAKARTWKPRSR